MAFAQVPPHVAAAMNRARRERAELNSPDPVTRWRTKERIFQRNINELTNVLVQQAKRNRLPEESDYYTVHF